MSCISYILCIEGYIFNRYQEGWISESYEVVNELDGAVEYCIYNAYDGTIMEEQFGRDGLRQIAERPAELGFDLLYAMEHSIRGEQTAPRFRDAKIYPLEQCYRTLYMCAPSIQCHDKYGDQYFLSINAVSDYETDSVFMSGGPSLIQCKTCPSGEDGTPGVFAGANAPYPGYSWGESSCALPTTAKFTDSIGTYQCTSSIMYQVSDTRTIANGEF